MARKNKKIVEDIKPEILVNSTVNNSTNTTLQELEECIETNKRLQLQYEMLINDMSKKVDYYKSLISNIQNRLESIEKKPWYILIFKFRHYIRWIKNLILPKTI